MPIPLAKPAAALGLAAALSSTALAQAPVQSWPQRSIKMIVPFPAGGGTDFIARIAARHLSDRLGQRVFVENRGGGDGGLGLPTFVETRTRGLTNSASAHTPPLVQPSPFH